LSVLEWSKANLAIRYEILYCWHSLYLYYVRMDAEEKLLDAQSTPVKNVPYDLRLLTGITGVGRHAKQTQSTTP